MINSLATYIGATYEHLAEELSCVAFPEEWRSSDVVTLEALMYMQHNASVYERPECGRQFDSLMRQGRMGR